MAIISFDPNEVVKYVPSYRGNRGTKDPCVVFLKCVPFGKAQLYSNLRSTLGVERPDETVKVWQEIQERQFVESVERISGFFIKGKEVTDPAEFYAKAEETLIAEILLAMVDQQRLSDGQLKNFVGDSKCTQEKGSPSGVKPALPETENNGIVTTTEDSLRTPGG